MVVQVCHVAAACRLSAEEEQQLAQHLLEVTRASICDAVVLCARCAILWSDGTHAMCGAMPGAYQAKLVYALGPACAAAMLEHASGSDIVFCSTANPQRRTQLSSTATRTSQPWRAPKTKERSLKK